MDNKKIGLAGRRRSVATKPLTTQMMGIQGEMSRRHKQILNGQLWATRIGIISDEYDGLRKEFVTHLAAGTEMSPEKKERMAELERRLIAIGNSLDGSPADTDRRRQVESQHIKSTVEFALKALHCAYDLMKENQLLSAKTALKRATPTLLPSGAADGDLALLKLVAAKLDNLASRGTLNERTPFKRLALEITANFQKISIYSVERVVQHRTRRKP
jgi:hypothetical protein